MNEGTDKFDPFNIGSSFADRDFSFKNTYIDTDIYNAMKERDNFGF